MKTQNKKMTASKTSKSGLIQLMYVASFALIAATLATAAPSSKLVASLSSSKASDAAPASGRIGTLSSSGDDKSKQQMSVASPVAAKITSGKGGPSLQEPTGLESNIANARIRVNANDMATAAGHHHGKSHGKFYMYTEVPKKHAYKMGFKRGNHKHMIERKESVHKSHVHSYFKWHDKKGKGSHKFEFKHHDKKKHHY